MATLGHARVRRPTPNAIASIAPRTNALPPFSFGRRAWLESGLLICSGAMHARLSEKEGMPRLNTTERLSLLFSVGCRPLLALMHRSRVSA
jgi:hypothetical protein